MRLQVKPLTRDRFDDLVELFERPGASIARGCYCMFYFMWFGAKSMFDQAGFVEVARRKPTRPVMRRTLRAARTLVRA